MMNRKRSLTICALLLAVLVCGALLLSGKPEEPVENAGASPNAAVKQTFLTYQGTEYPLKEHLETVLLIGTDSLEPYAEAGRTLDYYNFSQADFLMLLVLDQDCGTAQILQLNRDTMTDVPWLDVLGNFGGMEFKQLCLAFNYGDGGMKSCKNTVRAVSDLLFDAPIQGYIQIPMSAIGVVNDLVGGVPVTMTEDLTAVDPAFSMGATVHLNGGQAERFLRARMALQDDTNLARMGRHRAYLDSFQVQARAAFDSDSEFALRTVEKLAEYMQSNMTAQKLADLITRLDQAQIHPIRTAEGELVKGEEYYEFYVDEASLWELVKAAYCQ